MKVKIFFLFFLVLLFSFIVDAHLEGESVETKNYRYEIAFSEDPEINKNSFIAVYIENSKGERISGEKVWLRISKGDEVLFSSTEFTSDYSGAITLSYKFKEYGNHTIDVSVNGEKASYEFLVENDITMKDVSSFFIIVLIIFVLIGYTLLRK